MCHFLILFYLPWWEMPDELDFKSHLSCCYLDGGKFSTLLLILLETSSTVISGVDLSLIILHGNVWHRLIWMYIIYLLTYWVRDTCSRFVTPLTEQMNNPLLRLRVCCVNIVPHELKPTVTQRRRRASALRSGAPRRWCPVAPSPPAECGEDWMKQQSCDLNVNH